MGAVLSFLGMVDPKVWGVSPGVESIIKGLRRIADSGATPPKLISMSAMGIGDSYNQREADRGGERGLQPQHDSDQGSSSERLQGPEGLPVRGEGLSPDLSLGLCQCGRSLHKPSAGGGRVPHRSGELSVGRHHCHSRQDPMNYQQNLNIFLPKQQKSMFFKHKSFCTSKT